MSQTCRCRSSARYIAPANSADCIQLTRGDCAPSTLLVRAPYFELRLDELNLFDNVNFTPVANPGTDAAILTATTAYRDPDNTFDPGGRIGQLGFRLNW